MCGWWPPPHWPATAVRDCVVSDKFDGWLRCHLGNLDILEPDESAMCIRPPWWSERGDTGTALVSVAALGHGRTPGRLPRRSLV